MGSIAPQTERDGSMNDLFKDTQANDKIDTMAQAIAIEDEAIKCLSDELVARKAAQEQAKSDLGNMIIASGQKSAPLTCGLTPKPKRIIKWYRDAGLEDEALFAWLKQNNLGGIIKPTVNFNTLTRTLNDYEDEGNKPPETMFNKSVTMSITMFGKTKFLANRNADAPTAE